MIKYDEDIVIDKILLEYYGCMKNRMLEYFNLCLRMFIVFFFFIILSLFILVILRC